MRKIYSTSIQSYLLLGDQKAEFRHYLVLLDGFIVLLDRIEADLLVILLKSSDVLPSLGELSLLHALADIPDAISKYFGSQILYNCCTNQ